MNYKCGMRIWRLSVLLVALMPVVQAQEVPTLEDLKAPDKSWTLLNRGTSVEVEKGTEGRRRGKYPYSYAWCVFKQESTGDLMSIVVDRYAGIQRKPDNGGGYTQSIFDRFPAGYPVVMPDYQRFLSPATGWSLMSLKLPTPEKLVARLPDGKRVTRETLEYVHLYEDPGRSRPGASTWLMGVGYAYVKDELAVYVQHTSRQVISTEEVRAYVQSMVAKGY